MTCLNVVIASAVVGFVMGTAPSTALQAAEPETVMVTLHVKPGLEAEAARVILEHWETARRLDLVLDATHLTLRGTEDGTKTYFVEVFTWRDANIPDSAPPAIQAIWKDMNAVVEPRGGRPGLHFSEVSVVVPSH